MKSEFSTSWISSKQPRKQRKYRANAPLHTRHKFLSANLSKELRNKHGKRSAPLRKGDEVTIMRGKFAKKKGKILTVNLATLKVTVDGINRKKVDGTSVNVALEPSNLMITSLGLDDKKRMKTKSGSEKAEDKKEKREVKKNASDKSTN